MTFFVCFLPYISLFALSTKEARQTKTKRPAVQQSYGSIQYNWTQQPQQPLDTRLSVLTVFA